MNRKSFGRACALFTVVACLGSCKTTPLVIDVSWHSEGKIAVTSSELYYNPWWSTWSVNDDKTMVEVISIEKGPLSLTRAKKK